jgi:hypothetical protein
MSCVYISRSSYFLHSESCRYIQSKVKIRVCTMSSYVQTCEKSPSTGTVIANCSRGLNSNADQSRSIVSRSFRLLTDILRAVIVTPVCLRGSTYMTYRPYDSKARSQCCDPRWDRQIGSMKRAIIIDTTYGSYLLLSSTYTRTILIRNITVERHKSSLHIQSNFQHVLAILKSRLYSLTIQSSFNQCYYFEPTTPVLTSAEPPYRVVLITYLVNKLNHSLEFEPAH